MNLFGSATRNISDEAIDWLLRIEDKDYVPSDPYPDPLERRRQFFNWVRQSPEHLKEFLELHETYLKLSHVDPRRSIDVGAMLHSQNEKIVPLFANEVDIRLSVGGGSGVAPGRSLSWGRIALAALLVCALVAGLWRYALDPPAWNRYTAAIGEQRSSKLVDGSVIVLNTDTLVEVSFTPTQRSLRLLRGEALFMVEKDPRRRPFVVDAGNVAVRAVGTQFDVYRRDRSTDIAVIEGRVEIAPDGQDRYYVNTGERARIAPGQTSITRKANIANAIAWRERRLVFEDEPLTNVVIELNRYNRGKVVLAGDVGRNVHVTANFPTDKVQNLVGYLADQNDLEVRQEADKWVIRKR